MGLADKAERRVRARAAPRQIDGLWSLFKRSTVSYRGSRYRTQGGVMAGRLKDKLALVTAAGQGIGRAIAEAFSAEGARVIATDLDETKLAGLKTIKACK